MVAGYCTRIATESATDTQLISSQSSSPLAYPSSSDPNDSNALPSGPLELSERSMGPRRSRKHPRDNEVRGSVTIFASPLLPETRLMIPPPSSPLIQVSLSAFSRTLRMIDRTVPNMRVRVIR